MTILAAAFSFFALVVTAFIVGGYILGAITIFASWLFGNGKDIRNR